jgi:effector-binding domain-containing protein
MFRDTSCKRKERLPGNWIAASDAGNDGSNGSLPKDSGRKICLNHKSANDIFMLKYLSILFVLLFTASTAMAIESAYPRTPSGTIEIKVLPAGKLIEHAQTSGSYFNQSNGLFGPLFRYIQQNNISMTTPVEALMTPGTMRFWISESQHAKAERETSAVRIVDIPERTVAAIGGTGAYSQENFIEARKALLEWVETQSEYTAVGDCFAAYWNGPLTPWFLKKFEVLVEVRK